MSNQLNRPTLGFVSPRLVLVLVVLVVVVVQGGAVKVEGESLSALSLSVFFSEGCFGGRD